jgi:hypothetical protein
MAKQEHIIMIARRPLGVLPGHTAKVETHYRAEIFDSIYKTLSVEWVMPFPGYLHINELLAARDGFRSLPRLNKALYKRISDRLGATKLERAEEEHSSDFYEPISENRCPTLMRIKLNRHLVSQSKPILIHPRPGHEYTMFYITYCSAVLDSGNYCAWSDETVTIDIADVSYPAMAWRAKHEAFVELSKLGFESMVEQMYNSYLAIHQAQMNISKYRVLKRLHPHSPRIYDDMINQKEKVIKSRMISLAEVCYIKYKADRLGTRTVREHYERFIMIAEVAMMFDPMLICYGESYFRNLSMEPLIEAYKEFCQLDGRLEASYSHLTSEMKKKHIRHEPTETNNNVMSFNPTQAPLVSTTDLNADSQNEDTPLSSEKPTAKSLAKRLARMEMGRIPVSDILTKKKIKRIFVGDCGKIKSHSGPFFYKETSG